MKYSRFGNILLDRESIQKYISRVNYHTDDPDGDSNNGEIIIYTDWYLVDGHLMSSEEYEEYEDHHTEELKVDD